MREGRGFCAASLLNRIRAKQKRKPDNVLRRRYAFRPNKPKRVTLKRGEGLHIASEAGSFGEGSVHNGYVTETNAGEGARCALIRVSLYRAKELPLKRVDTSYARRARLLRREFT